MNYNKFTLFVLVTLLIATVSFGQKHLSNETPNQKEERMSWWKHDRFGMFIHWGLYSLPARHEWVKSREKITDSAYQTYFDNFDPDHFEPKKWAREAKAAGMRYAVLTTKHHEGFCLFDSKYTDFKAPNTPAKRDLVREFVDAFRTEGIHVGFYYSLLDWHFPNYTVDKMHPLRPADVNDTAAYDRLNKGREMAKYREYLRNQITELLTNYGKIDILWLDFSFAGAGKIGKNQNDWGSAELLKLIRKLQPGIIVDNRLDLNEYADGADFETPEQVSPKELVKFKGKTWETCQTFSGSWGYYRDENTWKTQHQLLTLLITSVANGGNLILNVGPTARGEFDRRATNQLDSFSYWMYANSKAIYGCTYAPEGFRAPDSTLLTYDPAARKLYLHLLNYPNTGSLVLPGYRGKITYAQFLNDDSEVRYKPADDNADNLVLTLPPNRPPYEIPVIELVLKN